MIWIIGEYAERIDNADELLENFLDGFHDENTQVCCRCLPFDIMQWRKYQYHQLSSYFDIKCICN